MPSIISILATLATATTVVALPATNAQPAVSDFPEGFFAGYNHPDGTSTLQFLNTNQNFTFAPTKAPEPAGLQKRAGAYCWNGALNSQGVDRGMSQLRERLNSSPIGLGKYSDWPAYFGYNNLGVYVYFCVNYDGWNYYHSFTHQDLNEMSYYMDQQCGAYRDGYVEHGDFWWALFGRAKSGTKICQGNSRS